MRTKKILVFRFSSYTLFTTATAVLKVQYTKSNSIPGNRTIICLRNCLNESEGNPEDSENEETDSENEEISNNVEKFKKYNEILDRFENVLKYEIDQIFQEKLMKPDSTQNSLKNFPYFSNYLRIFIFYWIDHETSKKWLFIDCEFSICKKYLDCFRKYIILIRDVHLDNLEQTQSAARDFKDHVTLKMKMNRHNCTGLNARNANDPDTSEVEKLLSMGTAYILLFLKAFFIVAIWEKKVGIYQLSRSRRNRNLLIDELLISRTPAQIILPDELKSTALIQFIEMLFRFDEHLDF